MKITSTEGQDKLSIKDTNFKQLQRDIERDVVVVNGVKIMGSLGIEEVINEICRAVNLAFSSSNMKLPPDEFKREFAISCLRKAARTNSGGNSFQALQVSNNINNHRL